MSTDELSTEPSVLATTDHEDGSTRSDERPWKKLSTAGGYLGESVAHHDFVDKVRGRLPYADDWSMPGMLYGRIVRSQMPAAKIRSIDTSEALAVEGVAAVLTAADVPANQLAVDASGLGLSTIETPILADQVVRYVGEPVAIVAAETAEAAEAAAEMVFVDYEPLTPILSMDDALAEGKPVLHPHDTVVGKDGGTNVLMEWNFGRGDLDQAFADADVVIEETYHTHRVDHAYLEPEGGVGWVDPNGVVVLRVATQVIEHARHIARILQVPQSQVRVIGTYMGGGFGGKEDMTIEPYLALLVARTRRPVKMVWSRQESLQARPKRHPIRMQYRTAAAADGTILAQDIDVLGDAGAYPTLSQRVLFAAGVVGGGPYRTGSVRVRSRAVMTNTVPSSAFRGFGAMQMTLGYEGQMDRLADALGLSPEEVRRRNFVEKGDLLPTGEDLHTKVALNELLDETLSRLGPRPEARPGVLVGRGFACNIQPYGRAVYFADQASCWMSIEPDGSVLVRAGVPDLGGGQAASLAQIAAEVLGVDIDEVTVHISDTALTPLTGGTYATRQLYMSGNAAQKTALELRARVSEVAAEVLDAPSSELAFRDGRVESPGGGSLTLPELIVECDKRGVSASHLGVFNAEGGDFDPSTGRGRTYPDFTYGVNACDIEVDTSTGQVRLTRYLAGHDVGTAINPMRVTGQIEGGVVQGIGYALTEDCNLADGAPASMLFADYLIPVANELPDIEAFFIESGEGKGPFGARGIGEPPIGLAAPALAAAIADATGVRLTDLPFTPERVLEALATASVPA